jgi:hypothetical protein
VAARFVDFPPGKAQTPDIRFTFQSVRSPELHAVQRPKGPSRPFYDSVLGKAAYFPAEDGCYLDYGHGVRVWCCPASGECLVSIPEPTAEQSWLTSHPMLTLPLLEMLKRKGRYGIHGAGVAFDGNSLLLPGKSGAGKSTLTIALDFWLTPSFRSESLCLPQPCLGSFGCLSASGLRLRRREQL